MNFPLTFLPFFFVTGAAKPKAEEAQKTPEPEGGGDGLFKILTLSYRQSQFFLIMVFFSKSVEEISKSIHVHVCHYLCNKFMYFLLISMRKTNKNLQFLLPNNHILPCILFIYLLHAINCKFLFIVKVQM